MKRNLYLLLAAVGLVIPYSLLLRSISANGFDLPLLFRQLFATSLTTFFAVDLILSIVVFCVFVPGAARRLKIKNAWLFILAALTIGLSFALPLFLYFRERQLESQ